MNRDGLDNCQGIKVFRWFKKKEVTDDASELAAAAARQTRIELVKSRPLSLERRYRSLASDHDVENIFLDFRAQMVRRVEEKRDTQTYLREMGRIQDGRRYFYIQPINQEGWLLEQTSTGWVTTRAIKNVASQTFLRRYETWDIVSVFKATDGDQFRLSSPKLDLHLVSPFVYQERMIQALLENNG